MWQLLGKIALLWGAYLVTFMIANALAMRPFLPPEAQAATPEAAMATLGALLVVSLLNTLVLAHVVRRSQAAGWKLTGAVFLLFYGTMTFMAQIETLAFPPVADRLPPGLVWGLFAMGVLIAGPMAIVAVKLLGQGSPAGENSASPFSGGWAWKLPLIALLYASLYFSFGYYVAWRTPAVAAYYGGSDPGSFFLQLASVARETPWLPYFQLLRGLMWVGLALPAIRLMRAPVWEIALAMGFAFAIFMNAQHLFPNPYMPDAVRVAHAIETSSSNFLFGILMVVILAWPRLRGSAGASIQRERAPQEA